MKRALAVLVALVGLTAEARPAMEEKKKEGTTATATSEKEIQKWIADLGDDRFAVRRAAQKALVKAGQAAVKPLLKALKDEDLEVRKRAGEALLEIDPAIFRRAALEKLRAALLEEVK